MNNTEASNEKIRMFLSALGYKTNNEKIKQLIAEQKRLVVNTAIDLMESDDIGQLKMALFLIKTSYEVNTELLLEYISREEELYDKSIDLYKSLSDLANEM